MSLIKSSIDDFKVFEDDFKLYKKNIPQMKYAIFNDLINDKSIRTIFDSCDTSKEFSTSLKGISKVFDSQVLSECFYTCKLGFNFVHVPSILFYVISDLMDKYPDFEIYPSYYLQKYINEFLKYENNKDDNSGSISISELLSSMKITTPLVNKYRLKIDHSNGYSEVFVNGAGICIVDSNSISDINSFSELEKLYYDANKGIMYNDVPIRVRNEVKVINNDIDWR